MSYRQASERIRRWRHDPVAFVREVFGVEPDAWQVDFLTYYNTESRVAAKACKGPGKTAVLAWCIWHFLLTRPFCKVVATSITGANLKDGLWAELAKWQERSEFLLAAFAWSAERIVARDHHKTWWASARQWSKDATKDQQANSLAGLHADYIMFVIDEAGGVPDAVVAAAEAALANAGTDVNPHAEAKLLICGNPTHLSGPLYRACSSQARLWRVIEITGDPDDPKRSPRISIEWAREMIKQYGREHLYTMVNVLGKFPPASPNALLGPDHVAAAMQRHIPFESYKDSAKILGVDVALQGDDRTVIFPRHGLVAFRPKVLRSDDPKELAGAVAQAIKRFEPDATFVDCTGGWGSGVVSHLRDWGFAPIDVQFAGAALQADVYYNKRTEMISAMCEWIRNGGCIPDIPQLKEELCAQTFGHKGSRLLMTAKQHIKDLIGASPDMSDALALTFAYPVVRQPHRYQQSEVAYNPFADAGQQGGGGMDIYNPLI